LVGWDVRGVRGGEGGRGVGVPEGTLSSRLANGRKKLAERLARRGVALSAAAVSLVLGEGRAAVPDDLLQQTCGLVADWAAGGAVPAPVGQLAEGGFTVRQALLIGAFAAVLTAAGVAIAARQQAAQAPPVADVGEAEPNPAPRAGPVVRWGERRPRVAAPKLRRAIALPVQRTAEIAWSRDGKSLAVRDDEKGRGPGGQAGNTVLLVPDMTAEPQQYWWIDLPPAGTVVGFSPDGKTLITAVREYNLVSGFHRLQVWVPELPPMPGGGEGAAAPPGLPPPDRGGPGGGRLLKPARNIDLDPEQTYGYHFAPDGKTFRTVYREAGPNVFAVLEVR